MSEKTNKNEKSLIRKNLSRKFAGGQDHENKRTSFLNLIKRNQTKFSYSKARIKINKIFLVDKTLKILVQSKRKINKTRIK